MKSLLLPADALHATAESEPALADIPEHERQRAPGAASKQPLHPHQHQLQHAGQGLSQQQGTETAVSRLVSVSVSSLRLL